MLDLLIIILLLGGLITGFRRGLIVQLIHMAGFIISLVVAYVYYERLADKFVLWIPYPGVTSDTQLTFTVGTLDLDMTFYRLLAFVLIFIIVKFVLQLIGSAFDYLKYMPVLGFVSRLVAACFGFLEFYFIMFFIFYIGYLLPVEFVQNLLRQSILAKAMFEHTPMISQMVKDWWYIYNS